MNQQQIEAKKLEIELQNKNKMRDDEQFNITFVEKVQHYECLYDYTRSDYKNIQIQDKAWQEIADEFNETPTNCKERWRNLRGCYTRHLKQQLTPGMRVRKPYYLAEHMNFIHPFTKTRTHSAGIVTKTEQADTLSTTVFSDDNETTTHAESEEILIDSAGNMTRTSDEGTTTTTSFQILSKNDHHLIVTAQNAPSVTTTATQQGGEISLKRKSDEAFGISTTTITDGGSTSSGVTSYQKVQAIEGSSFYEVKQAASSQDCEADLYFLKSLLPDISVMNPAQKRRLRIQVLSLIDNILCEG